MIELENPQIEPVEELGTVRQVRGQPAAGRLRRHARQRAAARAAVVPRGRGRDVHPDPRRLPRVHARIPGVKEDVTQIVLNVKKLRLKSFATHPVQLKLVKSGAGPVTAADISESADVEIVNPELPLMTLDSDDVTIEMDLTVERGVGYLAAERAEPLPIGVIPVDAIFTPVRKVNYYGREHARRPDDQLRQADHRDRDGRHDLARGGALARRRASWSRQFSLFTTSGKAAAGRTGAAGARAAAAAEHARHAHRGARPADAGLQLAQAQQHRQGRPAAAALRTTTSCACATSARSRSTR